MNDEDKHGVAALYDQMSVVDLTLLQVAFRLDRQHATTPETRAFCDDRLFLIDVALRARETLDDREETI